MSGSFAVSLLAFQIPKPVTKILDELIAFRGSNDEVAGESAFSPDPHQALSAPENAIAPMFVPDRPFCVHKLNVGEGNFPESHPARHHSDMPLVDDVADFRDQPGHET